MPRKCSHPRSKENCDLPRMSWVSAVLLTIASICIAEICRHFCREHNTDAGSDWLRVLDRLSKLALSLRSVYNHVACVPSFGRRGYNSAASPSLRCYRSFFQPDRTILTAGARQGSFYGFSRKRKCSDRNWPDLLHMAFLYPGTKKCQPFISSKLDPNHTQHFHSFPPWRCNHDSWARQLWQIVAG